MSSMSAMESTSLADSKCGQLTSSTEQNINDPDKNNLTYIIAQKCKEEMENNQLQKPLEEYIERVANYTGLSEIVINQVLSQYQNEVNYKNKYFLLNDRLDIYKYLADLYTEKKLTTYKNIFAWYKSKNPNCTLSLPQFQYMMNCLGFQYRKIELNKEILIEDPSLTFERYLYLKQLNNFRANCAPIYYIDERFFDSTYTFPKPWLVKDIDITSPDCDGYVFFHAVSKQGFLNGLFCSPTTKKDFIKWVSHILLPLFPGPSVIVMDNNDLHGSLENTVTKYNSKNDMLQYLRQRNIPFNEQMHKAELYELITKCSINHICYDVDELLKAHGHFVLRLPANFHDLSMTHFLWKCFLESESDLFLKNDLPHIKTILLDRLSSLPQELYDSFHDAVLITEKNILKTDSVIYKALETNYNIS